MRSRFLGVLAPFLLVHCGGSGGSSGETATPPDGQEGGSVDSGGLLPGVDGAGAADGAGAVGADSAIQAEAGGGDVKPSDDGGGPSDATGGTDAAMARDGVSTVPTADGGACGTRAGMRGLTMRSAMVSGSNRTYLVYLPQAVDPKRPVPLVFAFHGATMSGQQMHDITQYAALSDSLGSDGFALVFPDGQGGPGTLTPWNVANAGQSVCGSGNLVNNSNAVDFAFIDAMKADAVQDQCLDAAHVFATGFSMGGYLSHHIGCERADFRAVAPASGGTIADLSACPTAHVPIIIFHGTADPVIAPGCADPAATAQSGFPPSATLWAKKNGCQNTFTTVAENNADGGSGQCYVYDGCPSDGQVELCTFTGMGHAWAGGNTSGQGAASAAPSYPNATQLEWAFFKKYAW